MKYLLFIFLLLAAVIFTGCIGGNRNSIVTTPTPQIVYVTVLVIPTQQTTVLPTISTIGCECDLSGSCKEVSGNIEELIGIRQDCAAETVKRSKGSSGGTNLSYFTSDNPACDRLTSCTSHCLYKLQQHYDDVCLSGYQV